MKTLEALQRDHDLKRNTPEEERLYLELILDKCERERECERMLLPCPFCGARPVVEALTQQYEDREFDAWSITCSNQECGIGMLDESCDFADAAKLWNRRP